MGKTNFTFVRPLWMASLVALALFLAPGISSAQTTVSCQDNIVAPLDTLCDLALTPDMVSSGAVAMTDSLYVIVNDGQILQGDSAQNVVDGVGTFDYGLFKTLKTTGNDDTDDVLVCWGTVTTEDKLAPLWRMDTLPTIYDLTCDLIDDILNVGSTMEPLDSGFVDGSLALGSPASDQNDSVPSGGGMTDTLWVYDYCDSDLDVTFSDNLEYGTCDSTFYARIIRRYTVTDDYGNSSTKEQVFYFKEYGIIDFSMAGGAGSSTVDNAANDTDTTSVFQFREETLGTGIEFVYSSQQNNPPGATQADSVWMLTVNTCDPANATVPNVYPTAFDTTGTRVSLNGDLCNYSISESEQRFNTCADGYKLERSIKIYDWCTSSVVEEFQYTVKVGDMDAPLFGYDCALADTLANLPASLTAPGGILDLLNDNGIAGPNVSPIIPDSLNTVCNNFTISTGPMNCTASMNTTLAALRGYTGHTVVSDCEDPSITVEVLTYSAEYKQGFPTGDTVWTIGGYVRQNSIITGLPVGQHALVINATDNCYNNSRGVLFFEVVDAVKPVMKCDDELRVTLVEGDEFLNVAAYALATTEDVDEGSWDNCNLTGLEVRREILDADARADWEAKNGVSLGTSDYTPWAELVEFFCADVNVPVEVQLRGTDNSDNTSVCWLDVDVENGTNVGLELSTVKGVRDTTITCEEYADIQNAALNGYVGIIDQMEAAAVPTGGLGCVPPSASIGMIEDIDQCGFGVVKLFIEDAVLDISKNDITVSDDTLVINVVPRYNYWIKFPADDSYFCEDEAAAGVELSEDVACDLLTVYENDEIFYSVADPDACYKIFRTYRVINWCEYDGESDPFVVQRSYGYDPGSQDVYVVVDVNEDDDQPAGSRDVSSSSTGSPILQSLPNGGNDVGNRQGYYQYTQHIVVYDNTTPAAVVEVDEESLNALGTCTSDVEFTITITDDCSTLGTSEDDNVQVVLNGTTSIELTEVSNDGATAVFSGTVADAPLGRHTITVTVDDGCGNVDEQDVNFEVVDAKGPAPICHDGIVVELMPTDDGAGMAEVWAYDLIASDINDCTAISNDAAGYGQIAESAYSIFLDEGFVSYEDAVANAVDQAALFFDCTDAGTEPMVRVYAIDQAGQVDYCLTFVQVQDNNSICTPAAGGDIAGAVATETAANVEGVEVQLSGSQSMMYMTDATGSFNFSGLAQGGDYTITPQKDQNHLNGVSTFDLVLISKHILGVSQLDTPYKLIAADVNNSQSITTLDLIQLRKLILNIDTEFANNTSWRFIDKAHTFANPSNPWTAAIPEFKNINNLGDSAGAEFVAVKVGDVNGSATVEARAATGAFAINTAEQAMIAGNEYTIEFSADMANVAGYQFTLDVNNAEIVDVVYGAAKAENFGIFTKEGVVTTSFNGEAAGTLFSLVVRATADVNVSEAIQVSSRYTAAEAYTNDAELLDVALNVAGATAAEAAFALNQNTPNPFQGETVIGFNLPTAQEATITLQDVAGRTVKMIEGDFTKGYNQVTISANELPSAGVYFYTLTAGDQSATKKLILVDALNR